MKRREFLESTITSMGTVSAAALLPSTSHAESAPEPTFSLDPVAKIHLTPSITTSRIGMGTGVFATMRQSNLLRMERSKAIDLIRFCYDQGIVFFDMADSYGTHQIVAKALADKPRDSYTLSTKIWCYSGGIPEKERYTADILVKRFLKELNTDYLDMIQLHCLKNENWETELGYQFEPLEKIKQAGLIRAHGVSCHSLKAASMAAENPWVDVMHMRINTANMNMNGTWEENVACTKVAKKNGKGIIAMKILGEGKLKDPQDRRKSTEAVVGLDSVDMMIVGFEERQHVTEFLENVTNALKKQQESKSNS